MEFIYLGKIVNTHGIKGEVRILSDFDYKELVFKKDFNIYIGASHIKETIKTYRVHKNYDMVTFNDINDINDVLKYKGLNVYINREDLCDLIFDEDYIGLLVYTDHLIGKITDIRKGIKQDLLVVDGKYLIPKIEEFIKEIDFDNKKIIINDIKGLIDED